jgi:hypothetical protein
MSPKHRFFRVWSVGSLIWIALAALVLQPGGLRQGCINDAARRGRRPLGLSYLFSVLKLCLDFHLARCSLWIGRQFFSLRSAFVLA